MKFQTAIDLLKNSAAEVTSVDAFRLWVRRELRAILPHGALACGHGRIHAAGVAADYIVLVDFPQWHLEQICNLAGGIDTPLLRRWLARREPVSFDPADADDLQDIPAAWLSHFKANDLRNAIVHAVLDSASCIGTYFSFHRLPGMGLATQLKAVQEIVPLLHTTLMRVVRDVEVAERRLLPLWDVLDAKELEAAHWIGLAKTNLDIAMLMGQSENTVKHRVTQILKKLGFENRSQLAVAIAKWPPGAVARGTRVL